LKSLTAAGLQVVIVRDNPLSTFDIPTCLARSIRHSWYPGGSCGMEKSKVLDPAIFEAEKLGARDLENVHFIDLTDQICQKDVCWSVHEGQVMYRDNNHFTAKFADRLMPLLEANLLSILGEAR
jgi:hypothetical protein